MIYTNRTNNLFQTALESGFKKAKNVCVCSGYFGLDTIEQFKPDLLRIAKNGGRVVLVFGMIRQRWSSASLKAALEKLHTELQEIDPRSGVRGALPDMFHGKMYKFDGDSEDIYVGSSNFSPTGIEDYLECTVRIDNQEQQKELRKYIEELCSTERSLPIDSEIIKENRGSKLKRTSQETEGNIRQA